VALFRHAANSKLSQLSGVKRKLDLDPAKGRLWRKAAGQGVSAPGGRTDMSHLRAEVAFDPERLSSSVRQD